VTDEELIEAYYGCSNQAFDSLFERYEARILGVLAALTWQNGARRSPDDVDDAASEAWTELVGSKRKAAAARGSPGTFRGGSFKGWLVKIAVNKLRTLKRRTSRLRSVAPDDPALRDVVGPPPPPPEFEFSEFVRNCLNVLTEEQRSVFVLHRLEELTLEATADALGCSITKAWRLDREARDRLRKHCERQEPRGRVADG
jgi:RNA polymerase sigma factor (sigma-70 family)